MAFSSASVWSAICCHLKYLRYEIGNYAKPAATFESIATLRNMARQQIVDYLHFSHFINEICLPYLLANYDYYCNLTSGQKCRDRAGF